MPPFDSKSKYHAHPNKTFGTGGQFNTHTDLVLPIQFNFKIQFIHPNNSYIQTKHESPHTLTQKRKLACLLHKLHLAHCVAQCRKASITVFLLFVLKKIQLVNHQGDYNYLVGNLLAILVSYSAIHKLT